ncbi:MAG TPA: DUF4417 domain-containing protein [Verrucomicrobiota bacterium]|nr:DUF4417 domain-containing protein [Verrucomicrobiota bacterium]
MGFTGCINCKLFKSCGGHQHPIIFAIGCANFTGGTGRVHTDDMNPNCNGKFWTLWDDVGGLVDYSVGPLHSVTPTGLPRYVPQLQGRHLRPPRPLAADVVALRLFQVVGLRPRGGYGPRYSTAAELRAAYHLRPGTRVILVGVDEDAPLERFWHHHRIHRVCEALAQLGLEVTIPNYSFFTCVPRFQILRNRKRILLAAERLSRAGVRVAIHLNAVTQADWAFWVAFLREHTEVTTVALEFQTGPLANHKVGQQAFDDLDDLIDRVGRPLHILLVGAARFYLQARRRRWHFTLIDSEPFMLSQKRRVLEKGRCGSYSLKFVPTQPGSPVYHLFEANLKAYEKLLLAGTELPREVPMENSNQPALLL